MSLETFVEIDLDSTDRRFLSGALGLLSQRAPTEEGKAAFGLLSVRVKDGRSLFTKAESDLMHRVISATLEAGAKVRARSTDEGAQVRAAAVEAAYNAIKGKIENGKQQQ